MLFCFYIIFLYYFICTCMLFSIFYIILLHYILCCFDFICFMLRFYIVQGMRRFEAREKVAQLLQKAGLWRGQVSHAMSVPVCSRTNDIVEPRLKEQWFLDCSRLSDNAIKVSPLTVLSHIVFIISV